MKLNKLLFLIALLLANPAFAGTKLSQINNGGTVNVSTDQIVAVRNGATDELVTLAASAGTDTTNAINISSGSLANNRLSALSANQVLGALTATTPSGLAVPSCSSSSNALTWTSGTGFGCNTISGSGTVNAGTAGQIAYYATSTTAVSSETLSAMIDSSIANTQGDILYRNSTGWVALAPGTSGQFLKTLGASANPAWANASGNTNQALRDITFVFDGGGNALTSGGVKYLSNIPYSGTITGVTMLADQSCSATIDLWETTYAAGPPTVANTIVASDTPTLSSAQKSNDTTLTSWTTTVTAGNMMAAKLVSTATCQYLSLTLQITAN